METTSFQAGMKWQLISYCEKHGTGQPVVIVIKVTILTTTTPCYNYNYGKEHRKGKEKIQPVLKQMWMSDRECNGDNKNDLCSTSSFN